MPSENKEALEGGYASASLYDLLPYFQFPGPPERTRHRLLNGLCYDQLWLVPKHSCGVITFQSPVHAAISQILLAQR